MKVKEVALVTKSSSIELLIWDGWISFTKNWNDITMKKYSECEVKRIIPICVAQTFTDEVRVVTKLRIHIDEVD